MTTLRQDVNFPGVDNSSWPAPYVPYISTGSSATIVANTLNAVTGATGVYSAYVGGILNDTNVNGTVDFGCLVQWDFGSPLIEEGFGVFLRAANNHNNGDTPDVFAGAFIDTFGGASVEYKVTPAARVVAASVPGHTVPVTSGVTNYVRCEVNGTTLRANFWTGNQSEPGTWMMSTTMAAGPTAGARFGFRFLGGNAATSVTGRVRNALIYDFLTAAPTGDAAAAARLGARPLYRMRRRV